MAESAVLEVKREEASLSEFHSIWQSDEDVRFHREDGGHHRRRGILGSEIAGAWQAAALKVAILDVNPEAGKAAVDRMGVHGKRVSVFQCDVLNREQRGANCAGRGGPPGQAGLPGERRRRQQAASHDQRRAEVLRSSQLRHCAGCSNSTFSGPSCPARPLEKSWRRRVTARS